MVRGPDHPGGRRVAVGEFQPPGKDEVAEREDEDRLDEERDRDPEDRERVCEDDVALEGEEEDERPEEGGDAHRSQVVQELRLEPGHALFGDDPLPRHVARREREADVDCDREEDRLPGDRYRGDAEEEPTERGVEDEHRERVNRDHHEGQAVVAPCKVAPHQHHRRAGGDPEQDAPGDVTPPELDLDAAREDLGARDEVDEEVAEEEGGDEVHREGLDRPVHKERQGDGLRGLCGPEHLGKIDLHHDRIDHEEERDGYRDRDLVDREGIERDRDTGEGAAEEDPGNDAERHPEREVLLEGGEAPVGLRCRHALTLAASPATAASTGRPALVLCLRSSFALPGGGDDRLHVLFGEVEAPAFLDPEVRDHDLLVGRNPGPLGNLPGAADRAAVDDDHLVRRLDLLRDRGCRDGEGGRAGDIPVSFLR